MPCTTILVGKKASRDGSTMMARNEDSGAGHFTEKKFKVVLPEEQPRHYVSVISKVEIDLPDDPQRYTSMPNALPDEGIWGEAGINESNVAMSATETITSNPRVLGADPLVKGGIGEEDLVTIVLPYIRSAREGVERLGRLLETYGTYEKNGIGFQDADEIWWLETIGGHHWIAKRVPDDCYAVGPNQLGIDFLDLKDAFGEGRENLCSADLLSFIEENALDLEMGREEPLAERTDFDTRAAFGSHSDSDHVYNTPRAWVMERHLNPTTCRWDGENADFTPESDDLPWCLIPEKKITVEDVKYVLSSTFQGTEYDPYTRSDKKYRPIGVNRNNFVAVTVLRPGLPKEIMAVEWIAVGSNTFNSMLPVYANVTEAPAYLSFTEKTVSTESFYWANRLIGALADAHYRKCLQPIYRYQDAMMSFGHELLRETDRAYEAGTDVHAYLAAANERSAAHAKEETDKLLGEILFIASSGMKNGFSMSDS